MAKRILVVDDDSNIRRIVVFALTDESDYIVTEVSSGEAALLHISHHPVDLLFTDLRMPGMSGIDLVRRVRDLDLNTAVIVFTVSPEDLSPEAARDLKIDCLLEKPVEPDQLRLAVDLLLEPQRLLPARRAASNIPAAAPPTPVTATSPPARSGSTPLKSSAAQPARPGSTPLKPLSAQSARPGSAPLKSLSAQAARRKTDALQPAPIAVRLTPRTTGAGGRNYSDSQIETMRAALKELALEPDVQCAVLADMSGIVLTHWSRRRDINVTVIAALAAGNSMALAEIGRNLGQKQPGHLIIQEGLDQSILMAHMDDLLLLIAIGPNASLGWARIAILRACEEVVNIANATE